MTDSEKIISFAKQNSGYITTQILKDKNINSMSLTRLVREKIFERVCRGTYILSDYFRDEYYEYQMKSKQSIFSDATALYFYDLSDRLPLKFDIAVPRGYNGVLRKDKNVILHYVKLENFELGMIFLESPFGMKIKVYDVERTICDIIKNRKKMEPEIFSKALQRYSMLRDKDLNKLMKYAKILKVDKKVREYMEILL